MLKSLRNRLLIWFLTFSLLAILLIISCSVFYFMRREHIAESIRTIDAIYLFTLRSFKSQSDFFNYATSDSTFFITKEHPYIKKYKGLSDSIQIHINKLNKQSIDAFDIKAEIEIISRDRKQYDQVFYQIIDLLYKRGFKDWGIVGEMRYYAHKLERFETLDQKQVLTLRRHEKDYIIRNDHDYVIKHRETGKKLRQEIKTNQTLTVETRNAILQCLDNYLYLFEKIVIYDDKIGLRNQSSLKSELNKRGEILANQLQTLTNHADQRKLVIFRNLKFNYVSFTLLLIIFSIISSFYISRRITAPLVKLSNYINRFIKSNFRYNADFNFTFTNDEIGKLSKNFKILKDEIRSHIENLNKRVEKRTAEIQKQKNYIELKNKQIIAQIEIANEQRDEIARKNEKILLAEKKLKKAKAFAESIISNARDGIVVIDLNGNFVETNKAYREMMGYTQKELHKKNYLELVPKKWRERTLNMFKQLMEGKLVKHLEQENIRKDGSYFYVSVSASLLGSESGKPNSVMAIITDITERKEHERSLEDYQKKLERKVEERTHALKKAKEKAERADMLKSIFVANMSHEIRTPLNAIIGFSELLANNNLTKQENKKFIEYIRNSGNNLLSLINDILDFAKIEAGQITINHGDCNICTICNELQATFVNEKNRKRKNNLEIKLKKDERVAHCNIIYDAHRLRQILTNIIGNAIKFTDNGYIEFGYKLRDAKSLLFYVTDTGIGIPEDKLEFIFDRFGKLNSNKEQLYGGTGLGLAISKNLVELMGGKIWVESEEGKGSTFYFTVPYKPITKKKQVSKQRESHDYYNWENKIFLIAEDAEMNYVLLTKILGKTKAKFLRARTGKQAIEIFRQHKNINLILMDMQMPEMNGYQAATEIKKMNNKMPIIAQTALAMSTEKQKSIEAGCDDYISKPYKIYELLSVISKYI